ncbi:hypothetical protein HDV00_009444 [Rhizophlyctis rosea]|nr:hypothetical protein HDV00_009444 [Rhizophlyctis rosea]
MSRQTVENTIKGLEKFMQEGMKVTYLQSDQGSSFKGNLPEWCAEHGIKLVYSRPHSPWSNGVIENKNGVYKKSLFQLLRIKGTSDWVSLTPQVVNAMNSTMTFATKKSPNEIEDDAQLHGEVGAMIQAAANRRYKGKGTAADLRVGDYVRRRNTYDPSGLTKGIKTGYWSKEVYQIVRVVQNRKYANLTASYKIKNVEDDQVVSGLVARGELLKIPDPKDMEKIPSHAVRPPPVNAEAEDEEPEWEVESILDKKVTKRTRGRSGIQYKIKWKGYARPTWEPAELVNAPDLIRQYEAAHG